MAHQTSPHPVSDDLIDELPTVGDGSGLSPDDRYYAEEVQFALRNHGMPLEALRYPITPVGMHYLIVHFDIPIVNESDWQLTVNGLVQKPLQLSLSDLRNRPAVTLPVTLECAGNGRALMKPRSVSQPWHFEAVGTSEWTGVPLSEILEMAGLSDNAAELVITGLDWGIQGNEVQPYQRSLTIDEACRENVLIAYEMNGQPLTPQHGYPLRLVVPDWYGMASVKWLAAIEAVAEPFEGYQMTGSYRYAKSQDDPGDPVTLMRPRALMVPPGIPEFASRLRVIDAGPETLSGRAWTARAEITRVEVSTDNARSWSDAELEPPLSQVAWRGWTFDWDAPPGRHTLCVRASDSEGNTQPLEQQWNFQGMGNNMIQRVDVLVR